MDENITLKIRAVTFNRLTPVAGPAGTTSYRQHDGLGDRLQEDVGGVAITLTMGIWSNYV
ncbi:MAG: hypothetical protein WCE68_08395 [Anaerolineales bacterium]